jgi:hypothetical protein
MKKIQNFLIRANIAVPLITKKGKPRELFFLLLSFSSLIASIASETITLRITPYAYLFKIYGFPIPLKAARIPYSIQDS